MSERIYKHLRALALEIPYQRGKQRIASVVVDKRGAVLSYGTNSYHRSNPLQKRCSVLAEGNPEKCFLHAEVAAIVKCKRLDKAWKIYVARIDKQGNFQYSAPCPSCSLAIKMSGIKKVEFTCGE